MSYATNRLCEALAKLADVDEAIGDLMRRDRDGEASANLEAALNHTGAASALLDALVPEPTTPTEETAP